MSEKVIMIPSFEQSADGYVSGWTVRYKNVSGIKRLRDITKYDEARLVLLNALVPPASPSFMFVQKITAETAKKIVSIVDRERIRSYIGHEATAKLVSELLQIKVTANREMYKPEWYDVAIVVRLKKRLAKPEDIKNVTLDDVEFLLVHYLPP